jgi:hypothetical protein
MPAGASKSKCAFRRIVASDAISAPELAVAERILARLVALAYAGDNPDLFSSEADQAGTGGTSGSSDQGSRSDGSAFSCSALPLVARTAAAAEIGQHEQSREFPALPDW